MRWARSILPLMMAAACNTTAPPGEDPALPGGNGADSTQVALALLPSSQSGMTAAASGILSVRGRCLVLEAGGMHLNLAFATERTSWNVATGELHVGERIFRPGTKIEVGGGQFGGDAASLPWLRAPATECRERIWIVSSIEPA